MDLTVAATPGYFATMGAERWWLRAHQAERGPTAADYERHDTVASLAMGVGSLLAPLVMPKLLRHVTPGKGKFAKVLVGTAVGAVGVTAIADRVVRAAERNRTDRRAAARAARRIASAGAVTAVITGGVAITTTLQSRLVADRMWQRRILPDFGSGPAALLAAIFGWDFIYYWNHRFMHESRYMWAIHVVHHSSERYNLSTALRQPVADAFGTFLPYSMLALFGLRPELIAKARDINLLYQYWIHTDTIRQIGPLEEALNTPSHHRVHHGSNREYLDRNHGSILIVWDRLFGTFQREGEPVVYGLTKNINTFTPWRIATHEHRDILRDVAGADNWHDRLSFVVRGPGWAYAKHAEALAAASA